MTEKQTFPQEAHVPKQESELISDADLAMINEWSAAPDAARRTVDLSTPSETQEPTLAYESPTEAQPASQNREVSARVKRNRGAAAAAITVIGTAAWLGVAAEHGLGSAEFTQETTTHTVLPGEGLYNAAQDILGSETIDIRDAVEHINSDPANIDVLKGGLTPGEQLVIPIAVAGHEHDADSK